MPTMENYVRVGFADESKELIEKLVSSADKMQETIRSLDQIAKTEATVDQFDQFAKEFWRLMPRNRYEGVHSTRLRNSTDMNEILLALEEYIEKNPNNMEFDG